MSSDPAAAADGTTIVALFDNLYVAWLLPRTVHATLTIHSRSRVGEYVTLAASGQ